MEIREALTFDDVLLVPRESSVLPGQVDTRDANGAVSPDGRVMFIVQTDPNKFPTLVVYIRKT